MDGGVTSELSTAILLSIAQVCHNTREFSDTKRPVMFRPPSAHAMWRVSRDGGDALRIGTEIYTVTSKDSQGRGSHTEPVTKVHRMPFTAGVLMGNAGVVLTKSPGRCPSRCLNLSGGS